MWTEIITSTSIIVRFHISEHSNISKGSLSSLETTSGPVQLRLFLRGAAFALLPLPLLLEVVPLFKLLLDFLHERVGKRSNEYRGMISWGCCPEMSEEVPDLFELPLPSLLLLLRLNSRYLRARSSMLIRPPPLLLDRSRSSWFGLAIRQTLLRSALAT